MELQGPFSTAMGFPQMGEQFPATINDYCCSVILLSTEGFVNPFFRLRPSSSRCQMMSKEIQDRGQLTHAPNATRMSAQTLYNASNVQIGLTCGALK
uniref:Uncharacterized protein n=1 Tax=Caenorhabditis japonica TaxID=281687 RepID=A0A8R1EBI2_CAEJA